MREQVASRHRERPRHAAGRPATLNPRADKAATSQRPDALRNPQQSHRRTCERRWPLAPGDGSHLVAIAFVVGLASLTGALLSMGGAAPAAFLNREGVGGKLV